MMGPGIASPRGPGIPQQWPQQRPGTPQGHFGIRQHFPGPNPGQLMSPTQQDMMWSQHHQHMVILLVLY